MERASNRPFDLAIRQGESVVAAALATERYVESALLFLLLCACWGLVLYLAMAAVQ